MLNNAVHIICKNCKNYNQNVQKELLLSLKASFLQFFNSSMHVYTGEIYCSYSVKRSSCIFFIDYYCRKYVFANHIFPRIYACQEQNICFCQPYISQNICLPGTNAFAKSCENKMAVTNMINIIMINKYC